MEARSTDMRIIEPSAKIIDPEGLVAQLPLIEYAARVSHRSEEDMKADSWEKFINAVVIGHGDWSVTEHVVAPVEIVTDRGVTHEIVRHRLASYTQESTRFVNYAKKMLPSFLYPVPGIRCPHCLSGLEPMKSGSGDWYHVVQQGPPSIIEDCAYSKTWLNAIDDVDGAYRQLTLMEGWRRQDARSVFPNALASKIICTYNLRVWRHVFIMRTTREAHPQMRQVMDPLLGEFKRLVPLLFDDIVPGARQADNVRLPG